MVDQNNVRILSTGMIFTFFVCYNYIIYDRLILFQLRSCFHFDIKIKLFIFEINFKTNLGM